MAGPTIPHKFPINEAAEVYQVFDDAAHTKATKVMLMT